MAARHHNTGSLAIVMCLSVLSSSGLVAMAGGVDGLDFSGRNINIAAIPRLMQVLLPQALLFVTRSAPAISPEEGPLLGPEYPSPATLLRLQVPLHIVPYALAIECK